MKVEIRHAEPDDYRAIQQLYTQPKAIEGTLQIPFPSAELWKKRLAEKPENHYVLVACVDGKIVGSLGLTSVSRSPRRRHAAGIGMAVHDEWHGRGIGTALVEAAIELAEKWLNVSRLELTVFTDNEPAVKLYEKFGFKKEGTHEKYAFRDGEYVDTISMARIRQSEP